MNTTNCKTDTYEISEATSTTYRFPNGREYIIHTDVLIRFEHAPFPGVVYRVSGGGTGKSKSHFLSHTSRGVDDRQSVIAAFLAKHPELILK